VLFSVEACAGSGSSVSNPSRPDNQPLHRSGQKIRGRDMMTGVPRIFLESERMILRQFTTDDADLLFRLDNDADVMLYVNGGIPVPLEEIVLDLAWFLSYYERFDGYGFWAAVEKTTGRFLGWFHFRPDEGAGPLEPELGYRLHRFAWNQGYATEGSQALVRKGFTELGVERVTAHAMAVNVGSR
jgi:RimJ/RimL family protein N-acetyltransferase